MSFSKIKILGRKKTDKPSSILGHNPQLPCINIDDVLEIQILGQGAQGTVYKAHTKFIGTCAFKRFKTEYPVEYFGAGQYTNQSVNQACRGTVDLVRELKYSSEVDNHPNIVTFYSYATVFGMDKDNNPCPKAHKGILIEYMPGGSLSQYLSDGEKCHLQDVVFGADRVHSWALQIARALAFCHNVHQIIHRDVKPSNILLSEDYTTVKLTDFGIARDNSGIKSVGKGTPQFQAPETYAHSDYDFKADVYSYGLLLYTMTMRRRPFDKEIIATKGNQPLFYNHLQDDQNRPVLSEDPMFKELNGIIKRCWKYEPKERPTMHEIVCQLDKSPVPKK